MEYLRACPSGATDTELTRVLGGGATHQAVNLACRNLEQRGVVDRTTVNGIIRNALKGWPPGGPSTWADDPAVASANTAAQTSGQRSWYWEGNVQAAAVALLSRDGWRIARVANTASREKGKDIVADRAGAHLWVTVKGYYEGNNQSIAGNWARHSFEAAMLHVILWREEDNAVRIAVALPSMQTYQNLSARVRWFCKAARFDFIWVKGIVASWD